MNQKNRGTIDTTSNMICAGMTKFFSSYICLFKIDNDSEIFDCGLSEHMNFDSICFYKFESSW